MTVRIRVTTGTGVSGFLILACLAAAGLTGVMAWLTVGRVTNRTGGTLPAAAIRTEPAVPARPRLPRPPAGSVLGRFEVPALKMSWEVLEGTDDKTLDRSIGHVEWTPLLGERGNIGLAGHRNTHFRKLEWIRRGDDIVLRSKEGTFRYRVDYVNLHKPTDVDVLDPSHGSAVTLITCFPFEYVGSAPLRLIVRAVAVEESLTRLQAAPAGRTTVAAN
jgi:LPXTG-site transpeptidase (sortase) family protein